MTIRKHRASAVAGALMAAGAIVAPGQAQAFEWLAPTSWQRWISGEPAPTPPAYVPAHILGTADRGPEARVVRTAESAMPDESVQQSLACIGTGIVGTAAAAAAGGVNVINIIAGGLVVPTNVWAVYISMVGVVFASFCAIGQAATPAAMYVYDQYFGHGAAGKEQDAPRRGEDFVARQLNRPKEGVQGTLIRTEFGFETMKAGRVQSH